MDTRFLKTVREIADILRERKLTLSIAESCTGGFISHTVTNLPGASGFFEMSVVSYSERAKKNVLGISSSILEKYGSVSGETASAMAQSVRKISGTDVSLAITGVAGPDRMEDKDIGLVYIAVATGNLVETKVIRLSGTREAIKKESSLEALKFLREALK